MTNEQKALELLNEMGGDISKVIELLTTAKENEEWKPGERQQYFYIGHDGEINCDIMAGCTNLKTFEWGNVFQHENQAERYSKMVSLFIRMHKDAERRNKGKEPKKLTGWTFRFFEIIFCDGEFIINEYGFINKNKSINPEYYTEQDAKDALEKFRPELEELYRGDE